MRIKTAFITTILIFSSTTFSQSGLSIDWEWKVAHKCSSASPAFSVTGIPSETASLEINMIDQDYTSFDHGGGTVAHSGGATALIPDGALRNYRGPCPPNFSSFGHAYSFTVRAMASDGKTELARGTKTKMFSATAVKQ
jgi:phosphatidylethanolamine-binding protein (PEBP) family uncharacterized protein